MRGELDRERQRVEASEARQAEQDRRLDEVLRRLGELAAERTARRPWPGLKAWWRRVWEGEGEP